jgi:hypothetical protein
MIVGAFALLAVAVDAFRTTSSFKVRSGPTSLSMGKELSIGEYENVEFTQLEEKGEGFGKYRIAATIKSAAMNEFLDEYKKEMQRRKVTFPGFRPGKLPPYVMPDVRKYLVCFGLENMLGQLCNMNNLEVSHTTIHPYINTCLHA